jgi:nucleotide-binding universal stress UspA family protein
MFQHILVPTDGSLLSAAAMEQALTLARDAGARVTVLTATEPFHILTAEPSSLATTQDAYLQQVRTEAARILSEAERKAKSLGVQCEVLQVEHDEPYKAIIEAAKKRGCDLIAMASHGRRGVAAVVIGSETAKVLTHSSIPVLVYR